MQECLFVGFFKRVRGDLIVKINLYCIRHGETLLNKYKKMQGWADSPLTEEGKAVAIETGKKLAEVTFNRVYTSDSGRTVETAELILQQNKHKEDLVIQKVKEFREMFFGSFEGDSSEATWSKMAKDKGFSNSAEMMRTFSMEEVINAIQNSDPLGHAESYNEFTDRIKRGLKMITSENQRDENILLVTHGVVIMSMINLFSEMPIGAIEIKNSSITHLNYSNEVFKVISYNQ